MSFTSSPQQDLVSGLCHPDLSQETPLSPRGMLVALSSDVFQENKGLFSAHRREPGVHNLNAGWSTCQRVQELAFVQEFERLTDNPDFAAEDSVGRIGGSRKPQFLSIFLGGLGRNMDSQRWLRSTLVF